MASNVGKEEAMGITGRTSGLHGEDGRLSLMTRMAMKYACALIPILGAACTAQEMPNETVISAVGNFNPVSKAYLHGPHGNLNIPLTSWNKSSMGWGAEYERRLTPHYGIGAVFEQNPSDGKLYDGKRYYIWPQLRHEMGVVLAEHYFGWRRISPYLREGAGAVVTNGHDNCGWSHDFAWITGFGADYNVRRQTVLRAGMNLLSTKTGCYGDHTCEETWGVVRDVSLGVVYRWGFRSSPGRMAGHFPEERESGSSRGLQAEVYLAE